MDIKLEKIKESTSHLLQNSKVKKTLERGVFSVTFSSGGRVTFAYLEQFNLNIAFASFI